MAGGYLGKISAVISANTGDYVRGLNEGAKATRDFAKTVQSTLNRSATEAARAFEGIYTPLQQFERAIRQAGALRLNFKGFEGAVRNINDLQKRLNGVLTNNEIDLVVRTSGLRDIEAVRQAINSLSQKEITLTSNAGGLPGLLKARAELQASGASATTILNTKATQAELDALIEKLNVLDDRRIEVIIDVLNQQGLEKAVLAARRLQDAVTNIARPFAQTTQTFNQLAGSVQAAFIPAFGKIQTAVDRFGADLESTAKIADGRFESVRQGAEKAAAAVNRLAEAQRLASSGATGRELAFVSPRVADELRQSAALRNQAAALPPSVIANNPQIAKDVAQLQNLANLAEQYNAEVESQRFLGLDTTQAQRNLDNILLTSQRLRDTLSERISVAAGDASSRREADEIAVLQYRAQAEAELEAKRAAAVKKAEDQEIAILQYRARAEAELEQKRAAAAQKAEDSEIARLINRERAAMERDRAALEGGGPFPSGAGPEVGAPAGQLDRLKSQLLTVKGTLDDLPERFRAEFIPAIREAEAEFLRLNALGPAATAEEIEAARRRLQELADQAGVAASRLSAAQQILAGFGGAGRIGIQQGLNDRATQGYVAQLQLIQGVMAQISGPAANALVAAFEQVRQRIAQAAEDGTIRLRGTREEIERMIQALGAAAARTAGIDVSRLATDLRRVGDVGRAGLDRWSLAIQQAGFAVDDFFSVTGNLDQRIRAVSNNITQLAFILGSTRGLWIGIGAVIATQAVLALRKWINEGRTAEDQTKALNEALTRQQSIVDRLKQAFDSLGDAINRGTLSDAAERARDVADSIAKITQARREFSGERVTESDPTVQRERANINRATRERDSATTFGARVAAQAQIDAAQEVIDRRRRGLEALPPPSDREVEGTIRRRATGPFRRNVPDLPEGNDLASLRTRREALTPILDDLRTRMADASNDIFGGPRLAILAESYTQLENLAARLDAAISEIIDGPFPRLAQAAVEAGDSIRRAQESVSAAIDAGIPGAQGFQSQANEAGRALEAASRQLQDAMAIEDPVAREKAIESAGRAVDAANAQAKALDDQRESLEDATTAIQRFTSAIEATVRSAEANLNAAEGRRDRAREDALGRPTPRNERALERAERDVQRQRELVENARREAAQAEERARQSPEGLADERRLREINRLLDSTGVLAPGQRERLIDERERLRARQEARARAAADDPRVRDARDASIREEQRQQMVAEGRNLLLTDGQRARIELDNQIASVQAATGDRIAEAIREGRFNDIAAIQADQRRAEGRLREDAARQQAPTIFGLADQVQNAILQGPSRAALAPTDVTTMEGSRELTRLLRGDDASRNQDLVNLQKEANRLLKLLADNGADVAA